MRVNTIALGTFILLAGCTQLPLDPSSAVGANVGYGDSWTIQRRYDIAYEQCMYAKGNQIPGFPVAYAPPPLPSALSTPPRP